MKAELKIETKNQFNTLVNLFGLDEIIKGVLSLHPCGYNKLFEGYTDDIIRVGFETCGWKMGIVVANSSVLFSENQLIDIFNRLVENKIGDDDDKESMLEVAEEYYVGQFVKYFYNNKLEITPYFKELFDKHNELIREDFPHNELNYVFGIYLCNLTYQDSVHPEPVLLNPNYQYRKSFLEQIKNLISGFASESPRNTNDWYEFLSEEQFKLVQEKTKELYEFEVVKMERLARTVWNKTLKEDESTTRFGNKPLKELTVLDCWVEENEQGAEFRCKVQHNGYKYDCKLPIYHCVDEKSLEEWILRSCCHDVSSIEEGDNIYYDIKNIEKIG